MRYCDQPVINIYTVYECYKSWFPRMAVAQDKNNGGNTA